MEVEKIENVHLSVQRGARRVCIPKYSVERAYDDFRESRMKSCVIHPGAFWILFFARVWPEWCLAP